MAANVVEVRARRRLFWNYLWKVSPERLEFTTRLALICTLTTLVTEIYQTPEAAFTAYVAFFLNRPERTMSVIMSIALTVVISIVIGLIFLVAKVVADDPLWRVSSIAAISFGLLFLASASKLRPVAGTIALIVGYALDLLGMTQVGELATRIFLYTWLFVAIPAGISLIINFVLAPAPRARAEQAISAQLRQCAAFLREPASLAVRQAFRESAQLGVENIRENLKLAGIEKSASVRDLNALQQATLSTVAITAALEVVESHPQLQLPTENCDAIATMLDEMALILARGGYPVEVNLVMPSQGDLDPVVYRILAQICDAMTHFAEPVGAARKVQDAGGGFFLDDAFTNPEHVQFALKTTGAAVFCYCLYSLLDWPGIHTCFLTCYIVAQSTAAESVEKLTLRIAGCLVGAVAGIAAIVYLVPALTSIGGLLLAVFAGAWLAAYVAAGSPRISYAGFQFAFAFFLCLLQGAGPQLDLTIARDRIIGILIGNIVAYVALVHIWPMTVGRRIDPALASVLKRLRELVLADNSHDRQLIATEVSATVNAVRTDLALARYEPISIRASDRWLRARLEAIEQSRSLCPLLLLSKNEADVPPALIGERLAVLSANVVARDSTMSKAASTPRAVGGGLTLSLLIEENLIHLEEILGSQGRETKAGVHALI